MERAEKESTETIPGTKKNSIPGENKESQLYCCCRLADPVKPNAPAEQTEPLLRLRTYIIYQGVSCSTRVQQQYS